MHNDLTIHFATLEDMPVLVRYRRGMWDAMGFTEGFDKLAHDAAFEQWARQQMEAGRFRAWLLCQPGGLAVACAAVWLIESPPGPADAFQYRAYILNVYTEPTYRRQRLARRLMQAILNWCRTRGLILHSSDPKTARECRVLWP